MTNEEKAELHEIAGRLAKASYGEGSPEFRAQLFRDCSFLHNLAGPRSESREIRPGVVGTRLY